jgi:hypothetical protein
MAEKVRKLRLEREAGYLYFIDKEGDINDVYNTTRNHRWTL